MLASYFLSWILTWNMVDIPLDTPLTKTFPVIINNGLLRGESTCQLVSLILGPHLSWTCKGLTCAAKVSVSPAVSDKHFPWSLPSHLSLIICLYPLQHRSLSLDGMGFIKTSYLGMAAPDFFCSQPFFKRESWERNMKLGEYEGGEISEWVEK